MIINLIRGAEMFKAILVDDEPAVLKGLASLIDWQSLDIELVGSVTSGPDALAFMRQDPIHIMLTDICMPHMDGLALISEAKKLNPNMRFIIISAHGEFSYARQALAIGVENYLLKPINAGELAETLEKTLCNIRQDSSRQPEAMAFRTNILDRWANGSIQDFELMERAEVLHIDLTAHEFQCIVATPLGTTSIESRLKRTTEVLIQFQSALPQGLNADVFLDRNANLTAILRAVNLNEHKTELLQSILTGMADSGFFFSFGIITQSPYSLNLSYHSACKALPLRYLDEGPVVFMQDLEINQLRVQLMHYEQALEDLNAKESCRAASELLGKAGAEKSLTTKLFLALSLLLLGQFDNNIEKSIEPPQDLIADIIAIRYMLASQVSDAFCQVLRRTIQCLADQRNKMHPVVKRALTVIASSFSSDLSIKVVSDNMNINPSYFGQLFKSETGQSFTDYLTMVRLRAARTMLATTSKKISEIIMNVGISQQSYFNRLFRKEYGLTPMEYRRMQKDQNSVR